MQISHRLTSASPLGRAIFVVLALLVAWLAFAPHPPRQANLGWDKANHACAFMSLMLSAAWGWPTRLAWAGLGLVAYGGLIEIVQSCIPERSGEWADLLADTVGIAMAMLLLGLMLRLLDVRRFGRD